MLSAFPSIITKRLPSVYLESFKTTSAALYWESTSVITTGLSVSMRACSNEAAENTWAPSAGNLQSDNASSAKLIPAIICASGCLFRTSCAMRFEDTLPRTQNTPSSILSAASSHSSSKSCAVEYMSSIVSKSMP